MGTTGAFVITDGTTRTARTKIAQSYEQHCSSQYTVGTNEPILNLPNISLLV